MGELGSIFGRDSPCKPFPRIVSGNRHLLLGARRVLDIGAGRGRFARWFMENVPSVEEYVAVEPYPRFVELLRRLEWPPLRVVPAAWEDVRDSLVSESFDVVIAWDVAMFMDLRGVHGGPPLAALLRELEEWIGMTGKCLLFSLHPVKYSVLHRADFRCILRFLDSHPRLRLVAKSYLNRVYAKNT
ncbi:MAG: hypothetical protein DRJ67_05245 [Thermoprotei archaeon]|nr:MAG: hypothetical protein DRJ67_05245 [Thermoprotei archaeon]